MAKNERKRKDRHKERSLRITRHKRNITTHKKEEEEEETQEDNS